MNKIYLYPYSAKEARERNELSLWRESHRANIACRDAIEDTIRRNFDGMYLNEDCLAPVLAEYGYKRTERVLTATLQELSWDGRFSLANKQWAERRYIPHDERHNAAITVRSHPAVLDGFVNDFRKAQAELKLFTGSQCDDMTGQNLEGKVLVMSPFTLKESCWAPENQLWLATGGFGCVPTAAGRAVYATCLGDGEQTRWNRSDFIGILREEHLPDWARESLKQIRQEDPAKSPDMTTPTM